MASCQRRSDQRSDAAIQKPHFFKIIDSVILQDRKLRIPGKFVRKFGKDLSGQVFLKVPSGSAWQVEVVNHDGKVWFQNGWREFAEFYSIDNGYFLVFRYEGHSHFHVLIFDMGASEIEYPVNETRTEEIDSDSSVEFLGEVPTTERTARNMRRRKLKTGRDGHEFPTTGDSERMSEEHKHPQSKHPKPNAVAGEIGALQLARAFKSENPFTIVTMRPSYVGSKALLYMRMRFAKRVFKEERANLRVSDGRCWSVRTAIQGRKARIRRGWKAFVADNDLRVGDVCVFEQSDRHENTMNVVIFRAHGGGHVADGSRRMWKSE